MALLPTLPSFRWHMFFSKPSYISPAPLKTRQELSSQAKNNFLERRYLRLMLLLWEGNLDSPQKRIYLTSLPSIGPRTPTAYLIFPTNHVSMQLWRMLHRLISVCQITHNPRWRLPISGTVIIYRIELLSHIDFMHLSRRHVLLVNILGYQIDPKYVVIFCTTTTIVARNIMMGLLEKMRKSLELRG